MPRKELSVEPRQVTGKKVAALRRSGKLPANVYGRGLESVSVQIDLESFEKTVKGAIANEVMDLTIAGETTSRPVVIHKVSRHPLGKGFLHADFYQVSLRDKMRADVPVVLTGQSDAVTTYGGVLLQEIETVQIEALPLDIPAQLEIDVAVLRDFDASIRVRDLKIPGNVTVLTDEDQLIARVAAPRVSGDEIEAQIPAEEAAEEAAEAPAEGGEAEEESKES